MLQCEIEDSKEKVTALFKEEKTFLVDRIRERRDAGDVLAKTSAILMAYLCVVESSDVAVAFWPVGRQELIEIGVDLGNVSELRTRGHSLRSRAQEDC